MPVSAEQPDRPRRTRAERIERLRRRLRSVPEGSATDEALLDVLKGIVDFMADDR